MSDSPPFLWCWGCAGGMERGKQGGIAGGLQGLPGMRVPPRQRSATGAEDLPSGLGWRWEHGDALLPPHCPYLGAISCPGQEMC